MSRYTIAFMVFILMIAPAFAVECGFGFGVRNNVCVADVLVNWSTVIALISIVIMGIAYMIAQAVQSPRLINLVKDNLYQVLATVVILSVYMGGLAFLDTLGPALEQTNLAYPGAPSVRVGCDSGLTQGGGSGWVGINNHVVCYLEDDLKNFLEERITKLGKLNTWIGVVSTMTIAITVQSQSFYSPLFAGLGSIQQTLSIVMGGISIAIVNLTLQIELMRSWEGFFGVLLPMGIVLRMFPFTRAAGGVMIALVFGLTIVLPVMYLLIEDISKTYYADTNCSADPNTTSVALSVGLSGLTGDLFSRISEMFKPGGILACMAFRAGVEATVLPIFAYLMALNATRRLAEIMGADVNLGTLVRVL